MKQYCDEHHRQSADKISACVKQILSSVMYLSKRFIKSYLFGVTIAQSVQLNIYDISGK